LTGDFAGAGVVHGDGGHARSQEGIAGCGHLFLPGVDPTPHHHDRRACNALRPTQQEDDLAAFAAAACKRNADALHRVIPASAGST
jgi:hypothetical protein